MNAYKRRMVMDVFDYSGHKLCGLYDSSVDVPGQAAEIVVTTERNGWKELTFSLPSSCESAEGTVPNPRKDYLKADFRIRIIDGEETDWFLISEPRITHRAFSANLSVTAGHVSQLLKTKNLGLEFSDELGNNVGTAEELLTTILDGTGWSVGIVEDFLEKDGSAIKRRSLVASAKTGAFQLITKMCALFDAKPRFHGDTKTVDILHMNPFSEPEDGGLPDISAADSVLEIHYGHNTGSITRTQNTENLVTKLYAYGAYGDKTSGYCGIDEGMHTEVTFTLTEEISAGQTYYFQYADFAPRHFTPSFTQASGSTLIWSLFDPVSMTYIWDPSNAIAYSIGKHTQGIELPAVTSTNEVKNWFSFLMDFSYYQTVGLFTDEMLQKVAVYQREGTALYEISHDASTNYLNKLTALSEIIGDADFCKLNVQSIDEQDGHLRLNLSDDQYFYRTDYSERPANQFHWIPATELNPQGDPINAAASILYVIHDTTPVTWEKVYVKCFNGGITEGQDGTEQKEIRSITLWAASDVQISTSDHLYLFGQNNINGLLGAWEAADEAKQRALEESLKTVTAKHPVYFIEHGQPLPQVDINELNGYGWCWQYDPTGTIPSQMYFYFPSIPDAAATVSVDGAVYANVWAPVYFEGTPPAATAPAYWYNWANLTDWDASTLYAMTDDGWKKATTDIISGQWVLDADTWLKDIPFDIEDTWDKFGVVYHQCRSRDQLYCGVRNYYRYTVTGQEADDIDDSEGDATLSLVAGNYAFMDPYLNYHVFSTKVNLPAGSELTYDAFNQWIVQTDGDGIRTVLEKKQYPFDAVMYNVEETNLLIINKDHYRVLAPQNPDGGTHGILEFIASFRELADESYLVALPAYQVAQAVLKQREDDMVNTLGDLYREGWWQSDDYVDGDETKLYDDAFENLKKVAQPEAKYQIQYLDRYGAVLPAFTLASSSTSNAGLGYSTRLGTYVLGAQTTVNLNTLHAEPDYYRQNVTTATAVHLVDPDIGINVWAYVDKLSKCYDQPSKSTLSINTNLTIMAQHSFTDVMTNIANVANELKGRTSLYKRASVLTGDGILATERLEGTINAAKLKLLGGSSTWYTDDAGNMIFVAADGTSAMTLTGNGFAIANSKNEWGEWNWRTFGTGDGFTADEIVTGFLSSDRIQAASISSVKLDTETQNLLGWVKGSEIRLSDDSIRSTVTNTVIDEMTSEISPLKQSVIDQTAESIRLEFNEALTDIESSKEMQDNMNTWFDFSADGLKIGAARQDGGQSLFYTKQDNKEYSFWQDTTKLASITGEGMQIPQISVSAQFRIGDLYAIVDEDGAIDWVYKQSGATGSSL